MQSVSSIIAAGFSTCNLPSRKIGVSDSWPFVMGLNGLSCTGHILNS